MNDEVWIPLTQGKSTVIDSGDFDKVADYKWHAFKGGNGFYAARRPYKRKYIFLHQEILGEIPEGEMIDHVDGDGLNNRRTNLRFATRKQNAQNSKKQIRTTSSRFKGVCKEGNRWKVSIGENGKHFHLGRFELETEAALVYDRAALVRWGEFSRLNFPRAVQDDRTTILFVGPGRAGKDSGAEYLASITGLKYAGSFSWAAIPFMADKLKKHSMQVWEERHKNREIWKSWLDHLREGDETLLAAMALTTGEIAAGLRDIAELEAVRKARLFKHIVWINRPGIPEDVTVTFSMLDCDQVIDNKGTLEEFHETIRGWAETHKLLK